MYKQWVRRYFAVSNIKIQTLTRLSGQCKTRVKPQDRTVQSFARGIFLAFHIASFDGRTISIHCVTKSLQLRKYGMIDYLALFFKCMAT